MQNNFFAILKRNLVGYVLTQVMQNSTLARLIPSPQMWNLTTEHWTIIGHENQLIDVSRVHNIRRLADLQANNCEKVGQECKCNSYSCYFFCRVYLDSFSLNVYLGKARKKEKKKRNHSERLLLYLNCTRTFRKRTWFFSVNRPEMKKSISLLIRATTE